jgi:sec-independent protein translocase protein TatA
MSIGIWQVLLILLIVVIIFGAGKLPQMMGDLAKGVKSFKSGLKDDEPPPPPSPPPQPVKVEHEIAGDPAAKKDEHASG